MTTFQLSSGDLGTDRRYGLARLAAEDGEHELAIDFLDQAIERAPDWAPAWFALAESREALGDRPGAAMAFRRAASLDGDGMLGAPLHLARLGEAPAPAAAPHAYVRGLFDQYASRFDRHLVEGLHYRGPDIITGSIVRACSILSRPARFGRAIDLGCGTGLVAAQIHSMCGSIDGVDLSPAMAAKARATGRYGRVATGDILPFLDECAAGSADLLTAADVFIYIGDLADLFRGVRRVMARGALFAFTLQVARDGDFSVGEDLRYRHSPAYLERLGEAQGLAVVTSDDASIRNERGVAVPALALVMAAP